MMAGILERPNSSSKSGESILTNLNILITNLDYRLACLTSTCPMQCIDFFGDLGI